MSSTHSNRTILEIEHGRWIGFLLLVLLAVGAMVLQYPRILPQMPSLPLSGFPRTFDVAAGALQAQSAIVYDPTTGKILFAKDDEMQLPLASLTKLMTADTVLDAASSTTSIRVSARAVATEGDSGIKAGSEWKLGDLIKYALLVSSNDAMAAVAESRGTSFVAQMNDKAQSLGLAQSYFLDPTGLDVTPSVSGGYGSALDVAKLATDFYVRHPSFFESTLRDGATYAGSGDTVSGIATAAPILDIPGLIGAKTGYTDLAGGNLVAMFDLSVGHPAVAVVLHSTHDGRFDDVRTLIAAARAAQR